MQMSNSKAWRAASWLVVLAVVSLLVVPAFAADNTLESGNVGRAARGMSSEAMAKAKSEVSKFLNSKAQNKDNAAVKVALKLGLIEKFKTEMLPSLVDKYLPELYKREVLFDLAGMEKKDLTWGSGSWRSGWQKVSVKSLYIKHLSVDYVDSKIFINEKGEIVVYLDDIKCKVEGKAFWEGAVYDNWIKVIAGVKNFKVAVVIDMHASALGAPELEVLSAKGTLRGSDVGLDLQGSGIDGLLESIAGWFDDKIASALTDAVKDNSTKGNKALEGIVDPSLFTYTLPGVGEETFPDPLVVVGGLLGRARRLGSWQKPNSYTALLDIFETTFTQSTGKCSCKAKKYPNLGVGNNAVHVRISEYVMCCAVEVAYNWKYLSFYDSFSPADFVPTAAGGNGNGGEEVQPETDSETTGNGNGNGGDGTVSSSGGIMSEFDMDAITRKALPMVRLLTDEYLVFYNVLASAKPEISFTRANGATMRLHLGFNLIAKNKKTKKQSKLAAGKVEVEASLKPYIHENHIGAGLTGGDALKVTISGLKTYFRLIKASTFHNQLKRFVNFLVNKDVIPMVKKQLTAHRYDIALVDGIQFKNPQVFVNDGYAEVSTSVNVVMGHTNDNDKSKAFSWDAIIGTGGN